jgi:cardiolipin synthase A/B
VNFIALPDWLIALEVVWVIGMAGYILLERRPPLATVAWIVSLATLPVVGGLVYYFLGPRRLDRKRRRRISARSATRTSAHLRGADDANRPVPGTTGAALMSVATGTEQSPALTARSVTIFDRGGDAYAAILDAIRGATHHVHLEYYILRDGVIAQRLRTVLIERARAGVEVRLLLDGLGTARLGRFLEPMREAGVEIARFGPRMRPGFVNFRTHRKIVICDGVVGFTGGMNIDDLHDETLVGVERARRDTQVRIVGDAVAPLALAFLEDWQYATDVNLDGPAYLPPLRGDGSQLVQICASGPDAHPQSIHSVYFTAITTAQHRVWISTAYFVPDDALQQALISAALRGVDVQVLLSTTTDHAIVDAAAASYFPELLAAGVVIHSYGPPALHAKTMVVDRDAAIIGTANIDNRSLRLNFEVLAICYGADVTETLAGQFERDRQLARRVTAADRTRMSLGTRLFEGFARLLSPML